MLRRPNKRFENEFCLLETIFVSVFLERATFFLPSLVFFMSFSLFVTFGSLPEVVETSDSSFRLFFYSLDFTRRAVNISGTSKK